MAIVVVAEKPSVGRDLAKVLGARERGEGCLMGGGYVVTWAVGHLVRLPEPHEIDPAWKSWRRDALPMLPTRWPLVVIDQTADQFAVVARWLRDPTTEQVVCATDAGREGELIFRLLAEQAGLDKPVKRLWISSLTPEAIRAGFAALKEGASYDALGAAARGRAQADWLVGMNLTRAYTLAARQGRQRPDADEAPQVWSVGRVQTPTLALLVERERAIRSFVPETYVEVLARFVPEGRPESDAYEGTWFRPGTGDEGGDDEVEAGRTGRLPPDGVEAAAIVARVRAGRARIESQRRDVKRRLPPLLYDLTELQRDANRLYGLSAARTLEVAQELYETHKVLSYPRTDSRHLTRDVEATLPRIVAAVAEPYRKRLAPGTGERPLGPRVVDDGKVTDHHALLPTGTPLPASIERGSEAFRVYDLVVRRLLQQWHDEHVTTVTTLITAVGDWEGDKDFFRSSGTTVEALGWKVLEAAGTKKAKGEDAGPSLPAGLAEGLACRVAEVEARSKKTRAPRPFTEASLLTAMETAGRQLDDKELSDAMRERGLGTPATRASIVETLIARAYVERTGKALRATDKGLALLDAVHPDAASPALTGEWEHRLKRVERGEEDPARFMRDVEEWVRRVVGQAFAARARPEVRPAPPPEPATGALRTPVPPTRLKRLLTDTFGLDAFRPHQEEVCRAVTEGRNVLLVMPTGAGKSLCYQLPGVARAGTTLVISPLIALMEDQVQALNRQGLRAERIHSGRDRLDSRQACRAYLDGRLDFLYVAPERLGVAGFPELLGRRPPTLVAVDEAHCISHWGHDFRPDYRMIRERLADFASGAPIIALTATATRRVQDDICAQLAIPDAVRFILGFRRKNLGIEMAELPTGERVAALTRALTGESRRPAIVYAPSRRQTEDVAQALSARWPTVAYHAGLTAEARDRAQAAFQRGEAEVIVATIAFGMGIDKPDVRSVVHLAQPGSVEGYYQEIGRAGRDGKRSRAVLLHGYADRRTHEFFFERDYPPVEALAQVYERLGDEPQAREALQGAVGIDLDVFEKALEKLWIHGGALVEADDTVRRGADVWREPYEAQRAHRQAQLEDMTRLARGTICRMRALVTYFGDTADSGEACGLCDVCAPERAVAQKLRAPDVHELKALEAILRAVRVGEGQGLGTIHRRVFGDGSVDRNRFEALVAALARAGFVELVEASFEREGKTIAYRRARLLVDDHDLARLRARLEAEIRLPDEGPPSKKAQRALRLVDRGQVAAAHPDLVPEDAPAELVALLKKWRLEEARRKGVPAFRVLTDRALLGLAIAQPESEEEILQIRGIGVRLARQYGERWVELVRRGGRE